jgi:hypothetical protein
MACAPNMKQTRSGVRAASGHASGDVNGYLSTIWCTEGQLAMTESVFELDTSLANRG